MERSFFFPPHKGERQSMGAVYPIAQPWMKHFSAALLGLLRRYRACALRPHHPGRRRGKKKPPK